MWPSSRTFTISASRYTIGYSSSSGRPCHAFTSSSTASVTLEISVWRHLDAVHLLQVALDLTCRHPTCIHRDDLVVKAGPARLPLGHDLGIEPSLAVARSFQLQL